MNDDKFGEGRGVRGNFEFIAANVVRIVDSDHDKRGSVYMLSDDVVNPDHKPYLLVVHQHRHDGAWRYLLTDGHDIIPLVAANRWHRVGVNRVRWVEDRFETYLPEDDVPDINVVRQWIEDSKCLGI